MKVKAIKEFRDKAEDAQREIGDVFEVTAERLEQINGTYSFPLVEIVEEPAEDQETEPEPEHEPAEEKPKRSARRGRKPKAE